MAACWKFSWNVDPAALIVPVTAAALDEDEPLAGAELLPDDVPAAAVELDEEQAARDSAMATTAPPAVMTCCLRRSRISGSP
jgi:hypothetical protein